MKTRGPVGERDPVRWWRRLDGFLCTVGSTNGRFWVERHGKDSCDANMCVRLAWGRAACARSTAAAATVSRRAGQLVLDQVMARRLSRRVPLRKQLLGGGLLWAGRRRARARARGLRARLTDWRAECAHWAVMAWSYRGGSVWMATDTRWLAWGWPTPRVGASARVARPARASARKVCALGGGGRCEVSLVRGVGAGWLMCDRVMARRVSRGMRSRRRLLGGGWRTRARARWLRARLAHRRARCARSAAAAAATSRSCSTLVPDGSCVIE